jgi:hypothetical protein
MAALQPGVRVSNAPHFHCAHSWSDRLRLNSGVKISAGLVFPRDDWRPPSADELAHLTATDPHFAETLALFSIPERMHARWWALAADEQGDADAGRAAFQKFAAEVLEYFQFKQLPLPQACALEVVVTAPGQPSTRPRQGGLTAAQPFANLLGAVNLGDEESALVFLNLGAAELSARTKATAATIHEQALAFLTENSDYPLTRVMLRPAEGFWLPRHTIVMDGDTRGRTEIDVQLVIRAG